MIRVEIWDKDENGVEKKLLKTIDEAPEIVSSKLLTYLKGEATRHFKEKLNRECPSNCVITVPAYFDDN